MPDDSGGGLAALLGNAGGGGALASLGALVGGHQSIESDLTIARSQAVANDVADRLRRGGLGRGKTPDRIAAALRHSVDIEAIRGGILQITVLDHDPAYAKSVVSDYVLALRGRLATLNLEQTEQKKVVAAERMAEATISLTRAQGALDRFRLANRLAVPQIQLGAGISLVTELQGKLQAQQAELQTLQQFATRDNIQVQATRAKIGALNNQIAAAQAGASQNSGPSVGAMTPKISEYEDLYRNENYAQAEYEIYKKYLDTITVEQLSATINLNIIEAPYVDSDRQFNARAIGALVLVLMLGVLAEFYLARPPPGQPSRVAQ